MEATRAKFLEVGGSFPNKIMVDGGSVIRAILVISGHSHFSDNNKMIFNIILSLDTIKRVRRNAPSTLQS